MIINKSGRIALVVRHDHRDDAVTDDRQRAQEVEPAGLLRYAICIYRCVYVYIYIYICTCVYIYIYIYACKCIHTHMYTYTHKHMHITLNICVYIHIRVISSINRMVINT